jgi:hypothetical protein
MTSGRSNPVWVAVLASLIACGGPEQPGEEPSGSRVVLDPDAVIGEIDDGEAYNFGDVRSIAVDDEGRVYVGDRIGATVRVYSAQGEFISEIAREGEGPREVQGWPADLTFGPSGELYVRDAVRVTVFGPSGSQGIADSLTNEWRVRGYGNLTYSRSRVGSDGTYYYPSGVYRPDEPTRFYYETYRDGQLTGDTLDVPQYEGMEAQQTAFYRTGPSGGRMVDGLNHVPFATVPSWDVTHRGTLFSTDGLGADVLESNLGGDTVRVMRLAESRPLQIPAAERSDSLRALEARIDSLPVRLEDVVNLGKNVAERQLPEFLPNAVSLRIATGGLIWVERWPEEGSGDSRFYDAYDSTGKRRASVQLRSPLLSEPAPFFGRGAIIGVTRDEDTGVHRVVRFSLEGVVGEP